MTLEVTRKKLSKVVTAFFNHDEQSLKLPKSGIERAFFNHLQALRSQRKNRNVFRGKPRFELRGYPVYSIASPPFRSAIHKNLLINEFLHKKDRLIQPSVTVAVTYQCRYHCAQCYISEYYDPSRKELSADEFGAAFRKIADALFVWHFDITGGEPLEDPRFFEKIGRIPPAKATAIVATNGLSIDRTMISAIKRSNIMACKISLDVYAGLRSRAMQKALDSIGLLTRHKVLTFAQIFIARGFSRYYDLEAVVSLCRKAGAVFVNLISPMAVGNLKGHPEMFLSDEERRYIYFLKARLWRQYGYQIVVFPDWALLFFKKCCAADGRVYVSPYGDIYPCNFIPTAYGNVLTDDIKRVILRMRKDIPETDHCFSTNSSLAALKALTV